jgi:hypothetical protein
MSAKLDRSRPFATVHGIADYAFEQDGKQFLWDGTEYRDPASPVNKIPVEPSTANFDEGTVHLTTAEPEEGPQEAPEDQANTIFTEEGSKAMAQAVIDAPTIIASQEHEDPFGLPDLDPVPAPTPPPAPKRGRGRPRKTAK